MDDWGNKNPLNAEILAEDANQGAGGIAALPTRRPIPARTGQPLVHKSLT